MGQDIPNVNQEGVEEIKNKADGTFNKPELVPIDINDINFYDAVFASTATPGIFSAKKYDNYNLTFIDGGNLMNRRGFNNPVLALYNEALDQGYHPDNINIISLGTGKLDFGNNEPSKSKIYELDQELFWSERAENDPIY